MASRDDTSSVRTPTLQIVIWDSGEELGQRILRLLDLRRTEVRVLQRPVEISQARATGGVNIALAAFHKPPLSQDPVLGVIHQLRERGFSVFAFGEGLASWPLASRCRALLAGAQCFFDTKEGDFGERLCEAVRRATEEGIREAAEREHLQKLMKEQGVVGESAAILSVFRGVVRASRLSDLPVLLHGESGTGKELLARAIYRMDLKRSRGPFVALNCAAVSRELAESELFGHRRGAFTGAEHSRKGLVRTADGGVLLLDEIGDLSLDVQAKLLRVLQENRVLSVGEDEEIPVSVRVIAAWHRNPQEMVQSGEFRADLFHRLNVLSIFIPSLRDRTEDVRPLVEHFCEKYRNLRSDLRIRPGRDFTEGLAQLPLPGNARQVENIVRWAIAQKEDDTPLGLGDLPREVLQSLAQPLDPLSARETVGGRAEEYPKMVEILARLGCLLETSGGNLGEALGQCERRLLQAALERTRGNQSQTARLLGITPRSVYSKLRKYGLHPSRGRSRGASAGM